MGASWSDPPKPRRRGRCYKFTATARSNGNLEDAKAAFRHAGTRRDSLSEPWHLSLPTKVGASPAGYAGSFKWLDLRACGDGVAHARKDDWDRPRLPLDGSGRGDRACQNDVALGLAVPPSIRLRADEVIE